MTDFRALCAELAAELDHNRRCLLDDATLTHPLADRARAALAEPVAEPPAVAERPSDDELREIWETGHLPSSEELANDDGEQDLQFFFTSAYDRWLEENPDAMEEHEYKCIRAVFNAGQRWSSTMCLPAHALPLPAPQGVEVE